MISHTRDHASCHVQIVQTDPIDSVRKELSSTDYTWEEISFATTALTGNRLDAEQVRLSYARSIPPHAQDGCRLHSEWISR